MFNRNHNGRIDNRSELQTGFLTCNSRTIVQQIFYTILSDRIRRTVQGEKPTYTQRIAFFHPQQDLHLQFCPSLHELLPVPVK